MFGIVAAFIVSAYLYFVTGNSFTEAGLIVSEYLARWYLLCAAYLIIWNIFAFLCFMFNINLFPRQIIASRRFARLGFNMTMLYGFWFIVKYGFLGLGSGLLYRSFGGDGFTGWLFILGLILVLFGSMFKIEVKTTYKVTVS